MNLSFLSAIFSVAFSMPLNRRIQNRPVQVYSKTGQFMAIRNSGRVVPNRKRNSMATIIEKVSMDINIFVLRGVSTGLYVKVLSNGKIRGTPFKNQATEFTEKFLNENNFTSFRLSERSNCNLTISRKSFRVSCRPKSISKISFLSRTVHLPKNIHIGNYF